MLAAKQTQVDAFVSLASSGRAAPALNREQISAKLPPNLKARGNQILVRGLASGANGGSSLA
jgi:hypothetical protein